MENFDFINKLLDGRVVFGQKEMISDNVGIIPVYSTKIQFFNIKTDIKNNSGDGGSGSISIKPICIIKIVNDNIDIISFEEKEAHEGILDTLPNIFSNVDMASLLKNLKLN